jgi:hypothetical protein
MRDVKRRLKPKQVDFVNYYTNPASDTYGNAAQSAMKAGYSKSYAYDRAYAKLVPLVPKEIKLRESKVIEESTRHHRLLEKAEKVIEDDLDIPTNAEPRLRQIRSKTSHFIAETVGKDTFSKRTETITQGKSVIPDNALNSIMDTLNTLANNQPQAIEEPIRVDYEVKEPEDQ